MSTTQLIYDFFALFEVTASIITTIFKVSFLRTLRITIFGDVTTVFYFETCHQTNKLKKMKFLIKHMFV